MRQAPREADDFFWASLEQEGVEMECGVAARRTSNCGTSTRHVTLRADSFIRRQQLRRVYYRDWKDWYTAMEVLVCGGTTYVVGPREKRHRLL